MAAIPQPSREALQKVWQLGRRLATGERRLMPILSGAHHHATYAQFVLAHRHRLEISRVFEPWEAFLQKLTEEEGEKWGLHLDDPTHWERLHTYIAVPLRATFWYSWEEVYHLQQLYEQQVELHRREQQPVAVLRVHNPPQSPLIPCSPIPDKLADDDRWDSLALDLVDRLDGQKSDSFWHLPDPARIGQKSNASGNDSANR